MKEKEGMADAVEILLDIKDNLSEIAEKLEDINKTLQEMPWGQLNGTLREIMVELRKMPKESESSHKKSYRQ